MKELLYYFPFKGVELSQPCWWSSGLRVCEVLGNLKTIGAGNKQKAVKIMHTINKHCCYERQEEKFHIEASKNFFTNFNYDLYKKVIEAKKELNLL